MAPKKVNSYNFPAPMDNDTLIGHTKTMQNFMSAWENRDKYPVHPAWILTGTKGVGKATLAYKIAKKVYGNVGDFFIIDVERNVSKENSKSISVATVRAMIDRMQMSSMSGQWRVILIDSVDELSNAAANAILKMLEEPPAKTLFLLIVHQLSNVLPTIRSRARVEIITPLTTSELRELCIKFMPDADVNMEMLRLANGSFGKIADIKKSGGDVIYSDLISLLDNPRANSAQIMSVAKKIAPYHELHNIVLDAIAHYGLADLYPVAARAILDINKVILEPEIGIFKILMEIKKCL